MGGMAAQIPIKGDEAANRAALDKVPGIILGMGGLMLGLHWIIGRRMSLASEVTDEATSTPSNTNHG